MIRSMLCTMFVLLCSCFPCLAQDSIPDRLAKVEKANADVTAQLVLFQKQLDAICKKLDAAATCQAPMTPAAPAAGSCSAGCSGVPQSGAYMSQGGSYAGPAGLRGRLRARRSGSCGG